MNQNILKGILVLLVVLDHNEYVRSLLPRLLDGFTFHVVGFLMIPFLRPTAPWSKDYLTYLFRLYFPFFVFVTVMAILDAWLTPVTAASQAGLWLHALYSGNSHILQQVTQMALLWFLPSFIALVTLRTAIENAGQAGKVAAIALLCLAHPFIGTIAREAEHYLPLGLLPAVYVVPLAYLGVLLHRKVYERMAPLAALLVATGIAAAVKYAQVQAGLHAEIGFAEVADYRQPYALLLNDLEAVTGVLMVFQLARLRLGSFLERCGKYSLQVYLFHAFVALAVYKGLQRFAADWPLGLLFAVSLLLTVLISAALARVLAEQPLARRFLFPRSPAELLGRAPRRETVRGQAIPPSATHSNARQ
ncbi:acyltransferase family protein [Massilia niabensis]|uniref:Acyltransferase family protein n=1 Tax=Massilia niabensis TaxID=544910 RepID=A0ABW0L605_9BURK